MVWGAGRPPNQKWANFDEVVSNPLTSM